MKASAVIASALWTGVLFAHPMGNFSVNHYARLEPGAKGLTVTYVLDLAELPTTELIQSWGVDRGSPRAVMEAQAGAQARQWAANLKVTENGKPILGIVEFSQLAVEDGAANLPIFRISARIRFLAKGGRIVFEDGNYATRAGWREIVVREADGAELQSASNGPEERSKGLTSYPQDQEKAPPQDAKAWLEWRPIASPPPPVITSAAPMPVAVPAPPVANLQAAAPVSQPLPEMETGRATTLAGIVLAIMAGLLVARRLIRARYPAG